MESKEALKPFQEILTLPFSEKEAKSDAGALGFIVKAH